jgi:hypothetical protein
MRADLSFYTDHVSGICVQGLHQPFFCHNGQQICRAGESGNFQCKAVEFLSVIFMGKPGQGKKAAPEGNRIRDLFHKYHLEKSDVWNILWRGGEEQNKNRAGVLPARYDI